MPCTVWCTGSHLFDPQLHPEDRISITYEDWLKEKGYDFSDTATEYGYLRGHYLCIADNDPSACPGLHRAAELVAHCNLEKLGKEYDEELRKSINSIYRDHQVRGLFIAGNKINEDWQIVSRISDGVGHFNCGIYICSDLTQEHKDGGVLKVLPTGKTYSGYASREIHVLETLSGLPNIIQMHDYYEPDYEYLGPWIITEYCDGGTLEKFSDDMRKGNICVPGLFLWHVLKSLLTAAHACHTGQPRWKPRDWDPIFHRDIIQGNIFLMSSKVPSESYPTVVLADFGCAIAKSELEESGFEPKDLPQECPYAIPPEGPVASASADVWQIGLAVVRLVAKTRLMYSGDEAPNLAMDLNAMDYKSLREYIGDKPPGYERNFSKLLAACLAFNPRNRPTAGDLLRQVQKRRAKLMKMGELKFEPLAL